VGQAQSAIVPEHYIPDDGPSAPPLVVGWITVAGSPTVLSSVVF
jgi:hypothetical protein